MVKPLRLRHGAGRSFPLDQFAKPGRKVSVNALLGMGLWALLWLGYNTGLQNVLDPRFPASATQLIHGLRAFFPMLGGWFALLMIFARSNRLLPWIMGPLGLMLLFAVTGLASSAALSIDPSDALYFGANNLAIVLILLAIVLVENPLPDLRKVLEFTWIVGTILTLAILGAVPILGSQVIMQTESSPLGVRAYTGTGTILGMPSTRTTGFARYAAISTLVAFAGLMRNGKLAVRIMWGTVFAASLYALVLANGRTETLAFIASVLVLMVVQKSKRIFFLLVGAGSAVLLGFTGFYRGFFLYITRTGQLDLTMTGRTSIWEAGWRLFWKSPWVGLGFEADRYFGAGHMHNAFLHVLVESGFLGGGAMLIGLAIVWFYLIKYFFFQQPSDKSLIPPEIPAIFLFVTISSTTESTFAYFSAAWLLSAPVVAYVMALHRYMRRVSLKAAQERALRARLVRRESRVMGSPLDVTPSTPGGGIPD